ncbi:MAG TPA: TonB-dependent receptor, partial [Sphingobacterium sp.]|nr:TonB-dependent receptor [Sphingobacterium sp.]
ISAIGGGEISQGISETYPASVLYNYHDDYLTGNSALNYLQNYERRPVGTGRIPGANDIRRKLTNRDLSYFGNTSYHFKKRYGLSGSIRWDGSNLFGVKTNQKGVPLWSVGGSWEPSGERFYPIRDWLAYLRIRATYGISGNVNRSETHFPVSRYTTNSQGLLVGSFNSIGNPSLRWEKVKTTNLGAEWRVAGNRVRGRVEYYTKRGTDLIGDYEMDPTLGITGSYKINYADISTRGWDVNINMKNPIRSFLWVTDVNLSVVRNEITNFNTREDRPVFEYFYDTPPPRVGVSRDIVYAIPWNGLSADTGLPIVYMDGVEVTDYRQYYNNHLAPEQLTAIGLSVPPHYGALRNTFSWRGLELSTVISWKSGHVFRRMSMLPTDEYYMNYHQDYYHRWKSPGDEKTTNVPAKLPITAMGTSQAFSGEIYAASEALIESGDLIRFQEMSCSYSFSDRNLKKTPFAAIRINAYFRNLGILWKATPSDLDPDYHSASYTPPFSFSFGLQLDF